METLDQERNPTFHALVDYVQRSSLVCRAVYSALFPSLLLSLSLVTLACNDFAFTKHTFPHWFKRWVLGRIQYDLAEKPVIYRLTIAS